MSFVDEITKLQITNERNKVNKVHTRLIEVLKERNILQTELLDTKRDYAGLQNKYSEIENELFKIKDSANTYRELSEQLKTLECEKDVRDKAISQLKEEIAELKSYYEEQIFDLKTELKSESASKERALESAEYYKKLAENFQSMPDLKKLVDNIAGFKVPDIQEFVNAMSRLSEMQKPVTESINEVKVEVQRVKDCVDYIARYASRHGF